MTEWHFDRLNGGRVVSLEGLHQERPAPRLSPRPTTPTIQAALPTMAADTTQQVVDVFRADGPFSETIPHYAPREGQIDMAKLVAEGITQGRHVVVEGPCGTGKGVAYATPASIYTATCPPRTVRTSDGDTLVPSKALLVTANIALQEQLVQKDLPALRQATPWNFSFALRKGRRNFLCRRSTVSPETQEALQALKEPRDRDMINAVKTWVNETKTGDNSELPFEVPYRIWRYFSSTSEECADQADPICMGCFVEGAKNRAFAADVIVTNYHLLFAHLEVLARTKKHLVLPPVDVVVCDEAQKLADVARDFFGFTASMPVIYSAVKRLDVLFERKLQRAIRNRAESFFLQLGSYERSKSYRARLKDADVVDCRMLVEGLREAADRYAHGASVEADVATIKILSKHGGRCAELAAGIEESMELGDEKKVVYLERAEKGLAVLKTKAVDVAEDLRTKLFDPRRSVILTSATLAVDGKFDHLKKETGVVNPLELTAPSPFQIARQALLVIPKGLPDPARERDAFADAAAHLTAEIVKMSRGRVLGLFTSYDGLNRAFATVQETGYTVFRQGDAPRTKLVEAFRADVSSVLLGTESFWAGVDVPGESLSCVIIDRLPFATPNDPVLDAMKDRGDDWFKGYALPRAVVAFKQGFGRLIRRIDDRGVVVCFDQRLRTKGYGKTFLASLPTVTVTDRLDAVGNFLNRA